MILASIDNPCPDQLLDCWLRNGDAFIFFIFTFFLSITMDSLVMTYHYFDADLSQIWLMGAPSG